MEEFLQEYEEQQTGAPGFWKPLPDDFCFTETQRYADALRTISKHRSWKSRNHILTSRYLYACSVWITQSKAESKLTRRAFVSWKRVEAFSEESPTDSRFGFRLIRGANYQDFYVKSAEELEKWLDALANVAVMTDIREDFELGQEIGRGNYAFVVDAKQVITQKAVAVKTIIKSSLTSSKHALSSLVDEITLMRKLSHPRILRLLHLYEDDAYLYLILEYAGGGDLFHRLVYKGKFSEARSAEFMKELLSAIAYMHKQGVVHRDLKPENILMMTEDSDIDFKIADFGLAAEYREGEEHLSLRCGSPGYVAPEILQKQVYDAKVDIFSAGIILYIMYPSIQAIRPIAVRDRRYQSDFDSEPRVQDLLSAEVLGRNLAGRRQHSDRPH